MSYRISNSNRQQIITFKRAPTIFNTIREEGNRHKETVITCMPYLYQNVNETYQFISKHNELRDTIQPKLDRINDFIKNLDKFKALLTDLYYCKYKSKNYKRLNERLEYSCENLLSTLSDIKEWSRDMKTRCPANHDRLHSCLICVGLKVKNWHWWSDRCS